MFQGRIARFVDGFLLKSISPFLLQEAAQRSDSEAVKDIPSATTRPFGVKEPFVNQQIWFLNGFQKNTQKSPGRRRK